MPRTLDAVLLAVVAYHMYMAPYTKVEELFTIQAVHDIVNYGVFPPSVITDNYDHQSFPGVVPRTFVGAVVLAIASKAVAMVLALAGHDLMAEGHTQTAMLAVVRAVLGLANVALLIAICAAVDRITPRSKKQLSSWFLAVLVSQFHLLYYALRTLPNFVALPIVNYAIAQLLESNYTGLALLAFAGVVFRLEIGVFATIIAIIASLGFGRVHPVRCFVLLAVGSLVGLAVTVSCDLYFWGRFLWPEFAAFHFNVVAGQLAEWGTEPWMAYFNKYLWQLFRPPIVLLLLLPGLTTDPSQEVNAVLDIEDEEPEKESTDETTPESRAEPTIKIDASRPGRNSLRILFFSSVFYIAAMLFQPHKEWRFIIYTVPIFSLQAANALNNLFIRCTTLRANQTLLVGLTGALVVGAAIGGLSGYVSLYNYPGGDALDQANHWIHAYRSNSLAMVHMDVAACMSGITRFQEIHRADGSIDYDKTEDAALIRRLNPDLMITESRKDDGWELVYTAPIFNGVSVVPARRLAAKIQGDPWGEGLKFATQVVADFERGDLNTLNNLLQESITTRDYLYVYQRVREEV